MDSHKDIRVQSTRPKVQLTEYRCKCGRLLFKHHLKAGSEVEVKCYSCNTYGTVRAAEATEGQQREL